MQTVRDLPTVVIVGRPNVGKSTLFNRLVGERIAIVENVPGVTRDRLAKPVSWRGRDFLLVDTGGLDPGAVRRDRAGTGLATAAHRQALRAIAGAGLVVFVVDGREGLSPGDRETAELVRKAGKPGKPVLLVVNKVDAPRAAGQAWEFAELGFGEALPLSAEHGLNVAELLDLIAAHLPAEGEPDRGQQAGTGATRVCIVGRPNVGKSSLLNRLLDEERAIVSDVPGTTRDTINALWRTADGTYEIVDTAGLRRRSRIKEDVEYYSTQRALRAIDQSQVVLLLLDATEPVTDQDKRIAGYVNEKGKASVIVMNKIDRAGHDEDARKKLEEEVREGLRFIAYSPVVLISALTGENVEGIAGAVRAALSGHGTRLESGRLQRLLRDVITVHGPPRGLRIHSWKQVGTCPPTLAIFVNDPDLMHYSYQRYLENRLRATFDLTGTPVRFRLRAARRRDRSER